MSETILILGPTGRLGRNAAKAFTAAGGNVRCFDRHHDRLANSANGADVILNGWNPAYTDWAANVPQLTQRIIAAARQSGATVIQPGNVYNFGAAAPQKIDQNTKQHAKNHLGRIRIEMEAAYKAAAVRTIILRAGDFIDTQVTGNWFDSILTKNIKKGVFSYPGNADIPHAWAYLPDMARAAVALAARRNSLGLFEDVPFAGYTLSGRALCAAISALMAETIRLKRMSYFPIFAASAVWPTGRRLLEMRYLWSKPHTLSHEKFDRLLPDFTPTPVAEALRAALSLNVDPDQTVARASLVA